MNNNVDNSDIEMIQSILIGKKVTECAKEISKHYNLNGRKIILLEYSICTEKKKILFQEDYLLNTC